MALKTATVTITQIACEQGCAHCDFMQADSCGAPTEITGFFGCGGDTCLRVAEPREATADED